jgi:hypothetical protein
LTPESPPRNHSAATGGRDDSNGTPPGRLLGGGLELDGWCFHRDLPGCDLTVTHFHGHRFGRKHQATPSTARLVEVAEELDVLAQQASDVLNPCEHAATLAFAFVDDDGAGAPLTICASCTRESPGPGRGGEP